MKEKTEIKNKKSVPGQIFLMMTGFTCNNDCVICSVKPKGAQYHPRGTKEIIADLIKGRKLHYERVEFTGGEPTIRRDLPLLVLTAGKLGYKEIAIGTNARTFNSFKFVQSLLEKGVNRVTTTLYGHDASSHDSVTGIRGSFEQTVRGIKNLITLGVTTSVNTVLFNLTAKNLSRTGEFLVSLGIRYWTLLDLIPDGYALETYNLRAVGPEELKSAFMSVEKIINKFKTVNILDFPFCLVPFGILSNKKCNVLAAKGRTEIIRQVGYSPKRFEQKGSVYYDIHKIRARKCPGCAYNGECGGIWIPYRDIYGDSFIKPFSGKLPKK